jgi:hypothetical protein
MKGAQEYKPLRKHCRRLYRSLESRIKIRLIVFSSSAAEASSKAHIFLAIRI